MCNQIGEYSTFSEYLREDRKEGLAALAAIRPHPASSEPADNHISLPAPPAMRASHLGVKRLLLRGNVSLVEADAVPHEVEQEE